MSLPLAMIDEKTAEDMLGIDSNIVVYCSSFACGASVSAAKKLQGNGFIVLDYKGGLKEWQERGNVLAQ